MDKQFDTAKTKHDFSIEETSKYLLPHENRVRRLLEMQRRIRSLQVKRNHLRHELQIIEKYLGSLDSQIKSFESYEQLTFNQNNVYN